jgi:hypothetical protein
VRIWKFEDLMIQGFEDLMIQGFDDSRDPIFKSRNAVEGKSSNHQIPQRSEGKTSNHQIPQRSIGKSSNFHSKPTPVDNFRPPNIKSLRITLILQNKILPRLFQMNQRR